MIESSTPASNSNATEELFHTNLLRLQADQLLSESLLPLCSQTGFLDKEVKWSKDVQRYLEGVQNIVRKMDAADLSPDNVRMNDRAKKDGGGDGGPTEKLSEQKFWVELHSDKAKRHLEAANNCGDGGPEKWIFHFPGGHHLQMSSINSYAAFGAGLTTATANANVIPTVDLAVLLPVKNRSDDEDDSEAMISGKDYMSGRYFDKRNILAVHLAKFLSQKKQRKVIGSVHVVNEFDGDYRKVSLILTPPVPDDKQTSQNASKKRKSNSEDVVKKNKKDVSTKLRKKHKMRFRVRLVFGVQYDVSLRNKVEHNTGWIPSARLFPDRCNNKIVFLQGQEGVTDNTSTPTYNNALSVDMHHISTTQILHNVASTALKVFSETWTLLKIWCLQRGFLRGHDSFSEKTLGLSLAYLYRSKLASVRMDSVQVFTVWMKFMSDKDWLGNESEKKKTSDVNKDNIRHSSSQAYQDLGILPTRGRKTRASIVMPEVDLSEQQTILNCVQNRLYASDIMSKKNDRNENAPKTLLDAFKMNTDSPIFLDPTMSINYFGNMSPSFIRELKQEAKNALKCIHFQGDTASRIDPFRQLFLEKQRFWARFDAYVKLNIDEMIFHSKQDFDSIANIRNFLGNTSQDSGNYETLSRGIIKILHMALGDRVTALRILTTGNGDANNHLNIPSNDFGSKVIYDGDEIAGFPIRMSADSPFQGFHLGSIHSPLAVKASPSKTITIGIRINPNTCHRIVDRGPPADDAELSSTFVNLWGEKKAQLRRFKDGAIVHAVVWNDIENDVNKGRIQFQNSEKNGDIVERIVRHIVRKHFFKPEIKTCPQFALRNIVSLVENAQQSDTAYTDSSDQSHKMIKLAFDSLGKFLRQNTEISTTPSGESVSKLGLPLRIDQVEAISPALRYTELFPQLSHVLLGGKKSESSSKKVSGVIVGDPILIQIRFQGSSKWPQDINAMGAAKCAMLMQLAEGIDKMKSTGDTSCELFEGPINVMPTYLDLGYCGYSFRIIVRADEELKMIDSLRNPSQEAKSLKQILLKRHVISADHHFTINNVHTKYPAYSGVVRLLKRWLAAHMLSGLIPGEAVELLAASVFIDPSPLHTPNTVQNAFMRCLQLLSTHDWVREPLIVDPEDHISLDERMRIVASFEASRGPENKYGPPMFIISPNDFNEDDKTWKPAFTTQTPERVILSRLSALAKISYQHLRNSLVCDGHAYEEQSNSWSAIFQESSNSLKSYSALLRVDNELIYDSNCSSTGSEMETLVAGNKIIKTPFQRSMEKRDLGPKGLRRKNYKNLVSTEKSIIYSWKPIHDVVQKLRLELGDVAVFFYNELSPDLIGCLFRPDAFKGQGFSAMFSEFKRPIVKKWEENSLVISNASDMMRAIQFIAQDIAVDVKILNEKPMLLNRKVSGKVNSSDSNKRKHSFVDSSDDVDSSSDSD